jgi:hypothetical protein
MMLLTAFRESETLDNQSGIMVLKKWLMLNAKSAASR